MLIEIVGSQLSYFKFRLISIVSVTQSILVYVPFFTYISLHSAFIYYLLLVKPLLLNTDYKFTIYSSSAFCISPIPTQSSSCKSFTFQLPSAYVYCISLPSPTLPFQFLAIPSFPFLLRQPINPFRQLSDECAHWIVSC